MKIYLLRHNIDELISKITVVTFFSDEKPLKGQTGLLDWRMNGYISQQIQKSKINGNFKEKVLIPCNSKILSSKLFLLGMGEGSKLTPEKIESLALEIKNTLNLMKEDEFAFILSRNLDNPKAFQENLRLFFNSLVKHFSEQQVSIYYHYESENEKKSIVELKNKDIHVYLEKPDSLSNK